MRSEAIKPGDVIAGKYRVRAIMGRGRGTLVEALHTDFDQRVVARVLSPSLCDAKQIERFRREARILAKLESEHVTRILDVGTLPDGAFYVVRQYLEGADLATHLRKAQKLPLAQAAHWILQAAEAVAETHAHNILLRELQPSHLFLAQRLGGTPTIKVIDFGTAKLMRDAAPPGAGDELTATSMFGMSPYSSPELVRKAKNVDIRTDVWSLGAIFYELLAGRPPFQGEMAALMLQITREEPPPLTSLRRDLPREIDAVIGWSLAKDVDGRFANVHGFALGVAPFAPPEARGLVQRIAELTRAAKQRRSEAIERTERRRAMVDPNEPVSVDDADVDYILDEEEFDDAKTHTALPRAQVPGAPAGQRRPAAGSGAPKGPAPPGENPLDRTQFIAPDFVPQSPAAPQAPGQARPGFGSRPAFAGAAASPGFAPGAAGSPAYGQVPAAGMPAAGGMQAAQAVAARAGAQHVAGPPAGAQHAGAPAAAVAFGQPGGLLGPSPTFGRPPMPSQPTPRESGAQSPARSAGVVLPEAEGRKKSVPKGAVFAVAGAVLVLTLLIGFTVLKLGGSASTDAEATPEGASAAAPTAEPTETAAEPATPPASAEPVASAAPTAEPTTEPAATPTTEPTAAPPSTTPPGPVVATGPKPTAPSTSKPPPSTPTQTAKPTATAPPTTPPPAAGGTGTLVAVAVGGTCQFSVNGATKGTTSSIKLQVKPGTYSVSCKPATGGMKSKSVTVTDGGTAMAMF